MDHREPVAAGRRRLLSAAAAAGVLAFVSRWWRPPRAAPARRLPSLHEAEFYRGDDRGR
jgi:hypothetical protein